MPIRTLTTTAEDVFFGDQNVDGINFKNGSAAGTIYLRNKAIRDNVVSSTDYEWALAPGGALGLTRNADGPGIIGPWQAVASASVVLEVLPIFAPGKGKH